jgi:starvation-inducible outer membrane lipoprotein
MINKKVLIISIALALAGLNQAPAQEPVPGQNNTPLEVIATNGAGREKHLVSINGTVPMLMVRQNQTVPVTLQFPTTAAGTPVALAPLDGGRIVATGNGVVLPTGRMLFTFSPGAMPGRYRVMLYLPGEQQLLEFYVVDPNHSPWQQRPG